MLVLYVGNRGAAKQQCCAMNGVIEEEPATPLAARPEQRRMPHEHCSVQQLCFPPVFTHATDAMRNKVVPLSEKVI